MSEHFRHEALAAREFTCKAQLTFFIGQGVERAFDVNEMPGGRIGSNNIQFALIATPLSRPDKDGIPDEISAILQPFGDKLFEVVHCLKPRPPVLLAPP